MHITQKDFGQGTTLYSIENDNGLVLDVTNLGARIVHLFVPTGTGKKNIVLGFDSAQEYLEKDTYFGATIGRVAGRIKKGVFSIGDTHYQLPVDPDHGNILHGGSPSFEERIWEAHVEQNKESGSVIFSYVSPAGENGFPGTLAVAVRYTLNNKNEWSVNYHAETDQATLFNPTNHVYFNLTGDVTKTVEEHELFVDADQFVVVGDDTTATGEIRSVVNTPFDFRKPEKLKTVFQAEYEQNKLVDGLDHPFLFTNAQSTVPKAILTAPEKNICVELYTDQPAVVIFTAQFGEDAPLINGKKMVSHGGITLETQVSPGAIEFEGFGNIILQPEEKYESETIYKVLVNN